MAKADNAATTPDRGLVRLAGSFTDTTAGGWVAMPGCTYVNLTLSGTFVATIQWETSFDGGDTVVPLTDLTGAPAAYSSPGARLAFIAETDQLVRARPLSFTSGPVGWRVST
jgi:hypothetical protein